MPEDSFGWEDARSGLVGMQDLGGAKHPSQEVVVFFQFLRLLRAILSRKKLMTEQR